MSVYDLQNFDRKGTEETAFVIQHDWLDAFRDVEKANARGGVEEDADAELPDPTFFVGKRSPGKKECEYCTIYADPQMENFNVEDKFQIVNYSGMDRGITVKDPTSNVQTTFYTRKLHLFGPHKSALLSLDGTDQADYFVSSDDSGQLLLWQSNEIGETNVLRKVEGHIMDVNVCRFFPSGGVLLTGGMDMTVRVWSILESPASNVCTFVGHRKPITDLGFIDVGKEVLSASKDGTVRRWRCSDSSCLQTYQLDSGEARAICLIPSMQAFAVACEKNVVAVCSYNESSPETLMRFRLAPTFFPTAVTVVQDKYVVVGSAEGTLLVIDMETKGISHLLYTKRGGVIRLKSIVEKQLVAASFEDGSMVFYSCNSYKPVIELCNGELEPVRDFVYVKSKFYTASRDGVVRMFTI